MLTSSRTHLTITPLPADHWARSRRTGSLSHISQSDISARLGFEPTRHSVEGKSDQEWCFRAAGHDCSIWDSKGSGRYGCWSTCGPPEVFTALFGWRAVR